MAKQLLSLLLLIFIWSCSSESKSEKTTIPAAPEGFTPPEPVISNSAKYSYEVILCDSTNQKLGYGYNILMDGRIFIHQPSMPSIAGNKGFSNKEHAEKVAAFVINKLSNNIMPPSVTPKELDSLGVLH